MKIKQEDRERKDREASESIKENSKRLEIKLEEFLLDDELSYLRDWAFEYGDQLARVSKILPEDIRYTYLQVMVRDNTMREMYGHLLKAIQETPTYDRLVVKLPRYEDIPIIVKKKMDRNGKSNNNRKK